MKPSRVVTITLNPAIDQTIQVPSLRLGLVNKGQEMRLVAGGKGVNVAHILTDLGISCTVSGLLGEDNAEIFENLFANQEIDDHFIRIPGATRTNVKLNDPTLGFSTDINLPSLKPSPDCMALLNAEIETLSQSSASVFVLSGSLPDGLPVFTYAQWITQLNTAGKTVVLDSSGAPFSAAIAAKPALVKPNRHELAEWFGQDLPDQTSILAAARALLAAGPANVLVSLGEEGALLVNASGCWHAAPLSVAVVGTVGAGDAMVAGWIAAYLQGLAPAKSLQWATASAAARVCAPDGHLHREGLTPLIQQVEVAPV